jgi:hypothetical protein
MLFLGARGDERGRRFTPNIKLCPEHERWGVAQS